MSEQLNWQRDNFEHDFTAWQGDLWGRQRLGEQLTNYVDRLFLHYSLHILKN